VPLKKGKSKSVVSRNVSELMNKYEKSGKIGSSRPSSKPKAQKQAVAIALQKAGRSRKK